MKKIHLTLFAAISLVLPSLACTVSLLGTPSVQPVTGEAPSPSPIQLTPTISAPTPILPTPSTTPPTQITIAPSPTSQVTTTPGADWITPEAASGPYAVILVMPGDILNIRSAPGAGNPIVGTFAPGATNVMRSGASAMAGGSSWVQVTLPAGGNGWVNAAYLSEYVASSTFCADGRVSTLLASLDDTLTIEDGTRLASLVSPVHGLTVYLWRYGLPHTFKAEDARWIFESSYEHNWGEAPGSGLDTIGSFQARVLPALQEVFTAGYTLTCNSLGSAPQYGSQPWPVEYTGINYYTVFKPGTPGVDLDFRYWLVGVEYYQGQPYVFAMIHFAWEP